jgi:formate hydrogenlyase transcriptional activator
MPRTTEATPLAKASTAVHDAEPIRDDLEILLEVHRATATCTDLPALLRELVGILHRATRFDRLAVVLHDPVRNVMRLHARAASNDVSISCVEMPVDSAPAGIVWQTQQPLLIQSIARDPRFPEVREILLAEGMRSCCTLPLTSPLRRLGGLSFASRDEDAFRVADIAFLEKFTRQVALAVDNTLHHEAAEGAQRQLSEERDRLRLVLEINNALVSSLEPAVLFRQIALSLRRAVAHDYTSLSVFDAQKNAFDMWALEFAGKGLIKPHMTIPLAGAPAGVAFTIGTPACFAREDLARLPSDIAKLLLAEGVESMCCAPMTVRGRRLGAVNVGRLGGEPFRPDEVELLAAAASQVGLAVANALAFREIADLKDKLAAEKIYLEEEIRTDYNFEEIAGESAALKEALRQVQIVAPTGSTVLIRGETGTGKELIAHALHDLSPRRQRTLVKVNCAAIPSGLLESELFGHERGAFSGAITQRIGRFELANGGTLLLDEVGDIPLELQPKLLRVLQEQEFERLGSTRTQKVDVRLIAATNRSLEDMVAAGTFRSDLYYRLNVFPITLPPLRERRDDIPMLAQHFARKHSRRMNKRIETIPAETLAALAGYDWPGNVRELENAIERGVILTRGTALELPTSEFVRRGSAPSAQSRTLEATEREAILRALRESNWVVAGPRGAALRLGLRRTTLQFRMQKLGIVRPTA